MSEADLIDAMKQARALLLRNRWNTVEDVEDAVQDAALSALKTKCPHDGRSSFKTWFCRIAINARLMKLRGLEAAALREALPIDPSMRVTTATPESQCRRNEQMALITAAAERMTPSLYCAYLLHYEFGYPDKEAAAIAGVPRNTFKARVYRARTAIAAQCSSPQH